MSPRATFVALLLAAVAVGCPIPQAVPEYPKGTSVTPPRIVAETAFPASDTAILRVPAGCTPEPVVSLTATLVDENTSETVEARWFVDYDKDDNMRNVTVQDALIPAPDQADPNAPVTTRGIPPYAFSPYDFGAAPGAVHVVELVLSNGFPPMPTTEALPNRTPLPGFETQVYRWVFLVTNDACPPPP